MTCKSYWTNRRYSRESQLNNKKTKAVLCSKLDKKKKNWPNMNIKKERIRRLEACKNPVEASQIHYVRELHKKKKLLKIKNNFLTTNNVKGDVLQENLFGKIYME